MIEVTGEYRLFLCGYPGVCAICGAADAVAWSDSEEINCGHVSRHEALHFAWLDDAPERRPQDYVCDLCVDGFVREGRIAAYYSRRDGDLPGISEAAAAAGEGLHQKRAAAVAAFQAGGRDASGKFIRTVHMTNEVPIEHMEAFNSMAREDGLQEPFPNVLFRARKERKT